MIAKTVKNRFFTALVLFLFVAASILAPFSPGSQVFALSPIAESDTLSGKVAYDSAGNLKTRVDGRGLATSYDYDADGRLNAVRYADKSSITFSYDAAGQRTQMQDALGKTSYQYDIHSQLNRVVDALNQELRFAYEPRGLISIITYPDGSPVHFQWDANGWLTAVQDPAGKSTYKYDLAGRVLERILPNGILTLYQYDAVGRLVSLRHQAPQGNLVLGFSYQYDAAGNRTSLTRRDQTGEQQTQYQYDALYRLVKVTYADGEQVSYTYDASGNRTYQVSSKTGTTRFSYNGLGQLVQSSDGKTTTSFNYDGAGNLVERSIGSEMVRFTWDNENRLSGYQSAAASLTFAYDGTGRRLEKTVNGTRTQYLQSTGDLIRLLASRTGSETRRILPGLPAAGEISSSGAVFYLEDGLGSIVGLADSSARLTASIQYDAFGLPRGSALPPALLGYAGEQADPETGLIFLRSRYYDPSVGRFINLDPLLAVTTDSQALNLYTYAGNNPVNRVDPFGTEYFPFSYYQDLIKFSVSVANAILPDPNNQTAALKPYADRKYDLVITHSGGAPVFHAARYYYHINANQVINLGSAAYAGDKNWRYSNDIIPGLAGVLDYSDHGAVYDRTLQNQNSWASILANHSLKNYLAQLDLRGKKVLVVGGIFTSQAELKQLLASLGAANVDVAAPYKRGLLDLLDVHAAFTKASSNPGLTGSLGGVSLDKVAHLVATLTDIRGATFDVRSNQLVLIGRQDVDLPPMNMDDLVVAIRTIYGGQEPGMSIEPCTAGLQDGCNKVIYNNRFVDPNNKSAGWVMYDSAGNLVQANPPAIYGTHFGQVIFEADRYLKSASLGRSNLDPNQLFQTNVPGFMSEVDLLAQNPSGILADDDCLVHSQADLNRISNCHRTWFEPKEIALRISPDGQSMLFEPVAIQTLNRIIRFSSSGQMVDIPGNNPVTYQFISFLNQHYAALAAEKKELAELVQLAKIVGLVRWMKDQNIPVDLEWVNRYQVKPVETPLTTPAIKVSKGSIESYGGVEFPQTNTYLPPSQPPAELGRRILAARPSLEDTSWQLELDAQPNLPVAMNTAPGWNKDGFNQRSHDATLLVKPGVVLEVVRVYTSTDRNNPAGKVYGKGMSLALDSIRPVQVTNTAKPGTYYTSFRLKKQDGKEVEFSLVTGGEYRPSVGGSLFQKVILLDNKGQALDMTRAHLSYDNPAQPVTVLDAQGRLLPFSAYAVYSTDGNIHFFDAMGRLVRIRNALQGDAESDVVYTWKDDLLTSITGPNQSKIELTYQGGRLVKLTASDRTVRQYAYDAEGYLVKVIDQDGKIFYSYAYQDGLMRETRSDFSLTASNTSFDTLGRVTASQEPGMDPTRFTYDDKTGAVQTRYPSGQSVTQVFDLAGNLSSSTGNYGDTLRYKRDEVGRLVELQDAPGGLTKFEYSPAGNLRSITSPSGARLSYPVVNEYGRPELAVDPLQNGVLLDYDSLGHLTGVTSGIKVINISQDGRVSYQELEPLQSQYRYTPAGQISELKNPLGVVSRFQYTTAGQLSALQLPAGGTFRLEYDANAHLKAVIDPAGVRQDYTYNSQGQIVSSSTSTEKTSYTYAQGALTSQTDPLNNTIRYEYTPAGRISAQVDAAGGRVQVVYSSGGNIMAVIDPAGRRREFQYDPAGRRVGWSLTGSGSGSPLPPGAQPTLISTPPPFSPLMTPPVQPKDATSPSFPWLWVILAVAIVVLAVIILSAVSASRARAKRRTRDPWDYDDPL